MDNLFKFVGILCIGTAILSILIPTNRKVGRTQISKTEFERFEQTTKKQGYQNSASDMDFIPSDYEETAFISSLHKKQEINRKLSHAELFTKLEKEAGKEAIEYWINYQENELWSFELDKKGWDIWNKAGNIIKANYGTAKASWNDTHETVYNEEVSEFYNFVYNNKGWIEAIEEESCDIWWHHGDTPTTRMANNQQAKNIRTPPLLTETEIVEQSSKQKKISRKPDTQMIL
jgi:hypothetical protein